MTHFPRLPPGQFATRFVDFFFVPSHAENAAGNVKWKLKNWKKGSGEPGARLVMLYRRADITYDARDNLPFFQPSVIQKLAFLAFGNLADETVPVTAAT